MSIAYISDRTGIANVFLYDVTQADHYQLTNVVGSITAIAEYSPAISWARGADKLAFTYSEDGNYAVWATDNPRSLRKAPYRSPIVGPKMRPLTDRRFEPTPARLERGRYLALAGNCAGCHTARGGAPYAGGVGIEIDVGLVPRREDGMTPTLGVARPPRTVPHRGR